ncbi:hypothetical protein [Paraburkholderia sp. J41]|uniref:hypothetical protein n=1 Tax=Paraburkholderia sp. J41 TaxID=2805433 RepID=UPI002AC3122A|nr:hypothetical protein [Paraburkholderia sp. J41]
MRVLGAMRAFVSVGNWPLGTKFEQAGAAKAWLATANNALEKIETNSFFIERQMGRNQAGSQYSGRDPLCAQCGGARRERMKARAKMRTKAFAKKRAKRGENGEKPGKKRAPSQHKARSRYRAKKFCGRKKRPLDERAFMRKVRTF